MDSAETIHAGWVIEFKVGAWNNPAKSWLKSTVGTWGPDYLPTTELAEAHVFSTLVLGEDELRGWGKGVLRSAKITRIVEVADGS